MGESLAGGRQASAFPVLSAAIGHLEALVRGFRRARHLHASPTRTGRAAGAVPSRDVTARLGGGGAMRGTGSSISREAPRKAPSKMTAPAPPLGGHRPAARALAPPAGNM